MTYLTELWEETMVEFLRKLRNVVQKKNLVEIFGGPSRGISEAIHGRCSEKGFGDLSERNPWNIFFLEIPQVIHAAISEGIQAEFYKEALKQLFEIISRELR